MSVFFIEYRCFQSSENIGVMQSASSGIDVFAPVNKTRFSMALNNSDVLKALGKMVVA